jgi:endogenous inhibitor of DNA gyrase (YacG/DUF329 family)
MKKLRFRCPWCRTDVEVARRERKKPKGAKKKASAKKPAVQVIRAKCPECDKEVQLSRLG